MLFEVDHLEIDKEIDSKFVGVRDIKFPIKEKEKVKIKKEPIPIYKINVKDKELFVTIAVGRGIPILYISSNIDLLLKQVERLEKDLKEEMKEEVKK